MQNAKLKKATQGVAFLYSCLHLEGKVAAKQTDEVLASKKLHRNTSSVTYGDSFPSKGKPSVRCAFIFSDLISVSPEWRFVKNYVLCFVDLS